jgi:hypothetical protein
VTITGAYFTGTTTVRFGDTNASQLTVVSDQEVKALTPAHPPGKVDIVIVTPEGTSPLSPAGTYQFH